MSLWSRFRQVRLRGVLSEDQGDDDEPPRKIPRPAPTPTGRVPAKPADTPTTRPRGSAGTTAGTRTHRSPGGTPSTQRLHNPRKF